MGTGGAFSTAVRYLNEAKNRPSSLANVAAAQIYLYDRRHDEALTEAARAIALDPNDPEAHIGMAWTMITTGKPQAGLEFVATAMRLNPSYPNHYVLAQGMALFAMDELESAAAVFEAALERDPGAAELARPLAATYARLGRREDARQSLLLWRPGANQRELDRAVITYHFPFAWAPDGYKVKVRLMDGLNVAALPLDVTVPDLIEKLREAGIGDRTNAAWTLGRFGPGAAAAVSALTDALDDEEYFMRVQAVRALGKIGPAAEAAIPALQAIQDDERIGPSAKQALEKITGT
jgi:tetratricopeptide (TPR) repeat protein